jgi:hypothetical protein
VIAFFFINANTASSDIRIQLLDDYELTDQKKDVIHLGDAEFGDFISPLYGNSYTFYFDLNENPSAVRRAIIHLDHYHVDGRYECRVFLNGFDLGLLTGLGGKVKYYWLSQAIDVDKQLLYLKNNKLTITSGPNPDFDPNNYDDFEFTNLYFAAQTYINDFVTFDPISSSYSFTPDTTDCQTGAVGKFTFNATLTNISEKELSDLMVEVDELTNNNLLLTDIGLIGEGERFEVPKIDDYADGYLSADEYVNVPFTVCLKEKKPFKFFVNVAGVAAD